jgi:hypothetical protein
MQQTKAYIFFDEVNTCAHMSLIAEVILRKSINGVLIDPNVVTMAACNPYRRYMNKGILDIRTAGMTFKTSGNGSSSGGSGGPTGAGGSSSAASASEGNPGENNLATTNPAGAFQDEHVEVGVSSSFQEDPIPRELVYRVHPIPTCLTQFLFDFGSLSAHSELQYIFNMVRLDYSAKFERARVAARDKGEVFELSWYQKGKLDVDVHIMVGLIKTAQECVREVEGDVSCVSLRDVDRCLKLRKWFQKMILKSTNPTHHSKRGNAEILALAHVYYFRLSGTTLRRRLLEKLWRWLHNFISKKKQFLEKTKKSLVTSELRKIHIWIILKHITDSWFDMLGGWGVGNLNPKIIIDDKSYCLNFKFISMLGGWGVGNAKIIIGDNFKSRN